MRPPGGTDLAAFAELGAQATTGFALLAVGFLIKAAAIGVHVWLPGAYAEADDDLSAMLSGVVSKVAVMGLLIGTYLALRSAVALDVAHLIAWIGMLTTIVGALIAAGQSDLKRLLAFSSMSQLGYIVTAIALMSIRLGDGALFGRQPHAVKGILFLAAAGIILRTGTRSLEATGGLRHAMPITFGMVLIAVVAMSGLPPLMGFGGKWLLLSAMTDKGWYLLAVAGLVATFLGFVYMMRLLRAIFLDTPSPTRPRPPRRRPLSSFLRAFWSSAYSSCRFSQSCRSTRSRRRSIRSSPRRWSGKACRWKRSTATGTQCR